MATPLQGQYCSIARADILTLIVEHTGMCRVEPSSAPTARQQSSAAAIARASLRVCLQRPHELDTAAAESWSSSFAQRASLNSLASPATLAERLRGLNTEIVTEARGHIFGHGAGPRHMTCLDYHKAFWPEAVGDRGCVIHVVHIPRM
eukprot:gnl/TRDRNA2_/TRDRNA2_118538_c0_seq1.p1 gnl/TRDRNA2_/TRDRNA2_118538_c0~~gnl/TRDRNA2_/TRDRNA2_118538_c0_seq1.p1  ORF type:complete len:148 (+),score=10.91 gnl/TRDRNA2_/TRDRNA2_118538_c0_seq1:33-476(+)